MEKDPEYVAKLERAISEKYGTEAIQNPKKHWDESKEKRYLKDLAKFYKDRSSKKKITKKEEFTVRESKTLAASKAENVCPVCKEYSRAQKDDLYMTKFECCFRCYVQFVEDREARWKTGWRPQKTTF